MKAIVLFLLLTISAAALAQQQRTSVVYQCGMLANDNQLVILGQIFRYRVVITEDKVFLGRSSANVPYSQQEMKKELEYDDMVVYTAEDIMVVAKGSETTALFISIQDINKPDSIKSCIRF